MPPLSLVVCLHQQRDLLERLLEKSDGCYDDLVVVHDGPDTSGIRELVGRHPGRFFEQARENQQERHWPFAWGQAKYDWIMRLDADEFPSAEMKTWLNQFRRAKAPAAEISGYTCIWPLWNGKRSVTKRWPTGHVFLFDRGRVRFFGMPEQGPIADGRWESVDLVLHHEPTRKATGLRNILARKQAYVWRAIIARSLLGKPTDLPCWRWTDENWPPGWEQIRKKPLQSAFRTLMMGTLRGLRSHWRHEKSFFSMDVIAGPIFHALMCLKFWQVRRQSRRQGEKLAVA